MRSWLVTFKQREKQKIRYSSDSIIWCSWFNHFAADDDGWWKEDFSLVWSSSSLGSSWATAPHLPAPVWPWVTAPSSPISIVVESWTVSTIIIITTIASITVVIWNEAKYYFHEAKHGAEYVVLVSLVKMSPRQTRWPPKWHFPILIFTINYVKKTDNVTKIFFDLKITR